MSNWAEACDMLKAISLSKAGMVDPPATPSATTIPSTTTQKVETPEQLLESMQGKLSKLSGRKSTTKTSKRSRLHGPGFTESGTFRSKITGPEGQQGTIKVRREGND